MCVLHKNTQPLWQSLTPKGEPEWQLWQSSCQLERSVGTDLWHLPRFPHLASSGRNDLPKESKADGISSMLPFIRWTIASRTSPMWSNRQQQKRNPADKYWCSVCWPFAFIESYFSILHYDTAHQPLFFSFSYFLVYYFHASLYLLYVNCLKYF